MDGENRIETGNYNNQQQLNDECQCSNNNILSSDLNSKCQGVYTYIVFELLVVISTS